MYGLPGRNHPGTGRRVVGYFLWRLVMRQGLACAPVFEFLGGIRRGGRFCMICKVLDLGGSAGGGGTGLGSDYRYQGIIS